MKKIKTLLVVAGISIVLMVIAIVTNLPKNPEFIPPEFDSSAASGVPQPEEELSYQAVDLSSYQIAFATAPSFQENQLELYLTNPISNEIWIKARLLTEAGDILGETGLLLPGEYVQYVQAADSFASREEIIIKVMAYEPETYYSAGSATFHVNINENLS